MNIVELSPQKGYGLHLRFSDGVEGTLDLSSLAGRGVFADWLEPGAFEQVRLNEFGVPEWPGKAELCPDALYMELSGKSAEEVFPALRKLPTHA